MIPPVFAPLGHAAKRFERPEPPRKPALPKRDEAPLCGLKSEKDFITANAVDAILTLPKRKVEPTPDWLAKPEYGKAPTYLARIKGEIEAEHEFIQVRFRSSCSRCPSRCRR